MCNFCSAKVMVSFNDSLGNDIKILAFHIQFFLKKKWFE